MAVLIDMVNETANVQLLGLTVTTSGVSGGTTADFSDADDALNAIVMVASTTIPQTTAITSFVIAIQECSTTNGTYTTIPGMSCTVTSTTAVTNLCQVMRGLRTSQFIQASVVTAAGGTISLPFAVAAIGQKKYAQGATVTPGGYSRYPSA